MSVIARIRAYHAVLVALAVLAYATGELGLVHAWLGYGVAAVILFRLAWSLTGARQLATTPSAGTSGKRDLTSWSWVPTATPDCASSSSAARRGECSTIPTR